MKRATLFIAIALTFSFVCADVSLGSEPWLAKFVQQALQQSSTTAAPTSSPSSSCTSPNFCLTTYDSNKSLPVNMWPTNLLDINGWIGYLAYIIIIFLLPLVALVVLCNVTFYFWCCRKFQLCGGAEPKLEGEFQGYEKKKRHIMMIPIDIIVFFIGLFTILAIIFSGLFSGGVVDVLQTTFNSTDTVIQNVNNVENLILGIFPTINSTFDQAGAIPGYITQFNGPLNDINSDINSAIGELGQIRQDIYNIDNSSAQALSILTYLAQIPQLSGVPVPADVPQPSSSNFAYLDNAQSQLVSTQANVNSTIASVSDASNKFAQPIADAKSQVNGYASSISDSVTGPINTFKSYQDQYFSNTTQSAIKYYVNMAEIIRTVLTCVLICIPVFAYLIMLLVVYACKGEDGPKGCFKVTSCFTFFTAWIMFIIACVAFVVWGFATNLCNQGESSIVTALNSTGVSFQNKTLVDMYNGILTCTGKQDLLGVVGINTSTYFDFSQYQSQLNDQLASGLSQFNINSTLNSSRIAIAQFQNQSSSLTLDFGDQIATMFAKLQNVSSQVTIGNFFNLTNYQAVLDSFNAYTQPRDGNTYSYQNYTLMDPNSAAYSADPTGAKAQKDKVAAQDTAYQNVTTYIAIINANITAVNNSLIDIQSNYTDIQRIENDMTVVYPNMLNGELDNINTMYNQLVANVTVVSNNILGILNNAVSTFTNLLQCGWMSTNYHKTKDTICLRMIGYIGVNGLSAQFVGLLMFAMFPLLLMGSKYHGYKFEYRCSTVVVVGTASPMTPMGMGDDVEMVHAQHEEKHYELERDF